MCHCTAPPSLWIASAVFGIFLAEYVRAATAAARKRGKIVVAQVKLSEARFGTRQYLSEYQPPGDANPIGAGIVAFQGQCRKWLVGGCVAETPRNAGVSLQGKAPKAITQRYKLPLHEAAMSRLKRRCLSLALIRKARRGDVWRLTAVVEGSERRWRRTGQQHRCGAMKPQPGPASARASALAVGRRTQKGLRLNAQ